MEMIDDIVREIREGMPQKMEGFCNGELVVLDTAKLADRIDAAHKREVVTDCNGLNGAKMHEALIQIRDSVYIDPDDNKCHSNIDASDLREICDAALVEPARNCDRFSKAEVLKVLDNCSFSKEDTIEWLYAKEKGGAK